MGEKRKRKNKDNSGRSLLSLENIVSMTEKLNFSRNKYIIVIILIIGILLMIMPVSKNRDIPDMSDDESRLCAILTQIEGCGDVSVLISYNQVDNYRGETVTAKGAVVVAEGADDVSVRNKISEAVMAALDLPAHKVRVYKAKQKG